MNQITKRKAKKSKYRLEYLVYFICLLLISCVDKTKQNTNTGIVESGESINNKDDTDTILHHQVGLNGTKVGYKDFIYHGILTKVVTSANDIDECLDWRFESKTFMNLLKDMYLVEGAEWGALCYNYPCYYKGSITNERDSFSITINAASNVVLQNNKEVLYFILEEQDARFLMPCNCCEE